jgi:hypothetical protein
MMQLARQEPTLHIRQGESFRHAWEIQRQFGELDRVLEWCKTELVDEWRWQLIRTSTDREPGRYCFYFDSERDYVAFLLQWS